MNSPSVSVLMPTFNRASFLPETLSSVFGQTLPPSEVILVDDGSTDDTGRVVESLLLHNPAWASRLRYVRQSNQGKSGALNTAIKLAAGDWIAFNDSDDTWLPEKLERQFEALRRFPECLASFTETSLNEFTSRHPEIVSSARDSFGKIERPSYLYPRRWPGTYQQTVVVRTDVMRRCGEIDTKYLLGQDVDFLFRLGLLTPFCYSTIPLVVIHRDAESETSLMVKYPPTSWTAMMESESRLSKWLSLVGDSQSALRKTIKHELALSRSALANRYILAGDVTGTRHILRNAMRDCPEVRVLLKWALAHTMPDLFRRFAARRAPAEFFQNSEAEAASATTLLRNSRTPVDSHR